MNIELRYFTGTGNSLKVLKDCETIFSDSGYSTTLSKISKEETAIAQSDLLGFCFPVYAFGIPRICSKYLKGLKKFQERQKAFIIITAGDSDEAGFSVNQCSKILRKKNCEIVYSAVVQMPINWTTSPKPPFPPPKEESMEIIEKAEKQTHEIALDLLSGNSKHHQFNYPQRYSRPKFYYDYFMFKHLGLQFMWRSFEVYPSCNGCQVCAQVCPTNSISMLDKKPVWSKTCEQCMRCVNFCPHESIYQTHGGDTKGKYKYHEPGFKPERNKNRANEY